MSCGECGKHYELGRSDERVAQAQTVEALRAEVKRLREALKEIARAALKGSAK